MSGSDEHAEEQAARIELAALYRLIDHHFPSTDGIYNHLTLRLPHQPNLFLIKRHDLLFSEVTASNLVVADMTKSLDERSHVNRPGFVLHGSILRARPDVNCVVHLHSNAGLAMSAHSQGLKMLSQNSIRFYHKLGYHPYEGITDGDSEGPRIAAALGADNVAVMLRNHGFAVVGKSPREAFERTRDLLIACETQLMLEATGTPIVEIAPELCERVALQLVPHDNGRGQADWPAWVRFVERLDPSYKL